MPVLTEVDEEQDEDQGLGPHWQGLAPRREWQLYSPGVGRAWVKGGLLWEQQQN